VVRSSSEKRSVLEGPLRRGRVAPLKGGARPLLRHRRAQRYHAPPSAEFQPRRRRARTPFTRISVLHPTFSRSQRRGAWHGGELGTNPLRNGIPETTRVARAGVTARGPGPHGSKSALEFVRLSLISHVRTCRALAARAGGLRRSHVRKWEEGSSWGDITAVGCADYVGIASSTQHAQDGKSTGRAIAIWWDIGGAWGCFQRREKWGIIDARTICKDERLSSDCGHRTG